MMQKELVKCARKLSKENKFYSAGNLLEKAGDNKGALDEFEKYVSSTEFEIRPKIMEKLEKGRRTEALRKAHSINASYKIKNTRQWAEGLMKDPKMRHYITDKRGWKSGQPEEIRNRYAEVIKHARAAGEKEKAKELSKEYQMFKQQVEGLEAEEQKKARNPINRIKGLSKKLLGSALIVLSIFFILFSANGITGNVILNEGASSSLSIISAVLVLIFGIFIWIKK